MTKKKIIGICIGAVVLAVAAAGVKEGSWLMKHRRMQNEFTHEMNAFTTKTNAELIQPTIVAEDDIYGWFFHEEDDGLYMNLYYQCEGSCGEYFADITVTDSETGKLYYSSEAENEAAE